MKRFVHLLMSLPFLFLCEFTGNIYNPQDPSYEKPSFIIDTASNARDGDTVTADTVRIILKGNDVARHRNSFRFSLDNTNWTSWSGDGAAVYQITLPNLPGGTHTLAIEVCYNPLEEKNSSIITFFKAIKPFITAMSDTNLPVDASKGCTLRIKAEGTGDLKYCWYRNGIRLDSANTDTLLFDTIALPDTGLYFCTISNAWGEIKSPGIHLQMVFRIIYDGNGNTGGHAPLDTLRYAPGAVVKITGNTGNLARPDHIFTGWNTLADGSGAWYGENDLLEIKVKPVTLYAQWGNTPLFKVLYQGSGAVSGTVPIDTCMYREGDRVSIPGNSGNLQKPGSTFIGWSTVTDENNGTFYTPGTTFIMEKGNVVLYAHWTTRPTFTLTYLGNGNTGGAPPGAVSNETGAVVYLADPGTLVKQGYFFAGWNTHPDGGGRKYEQSSSYIMGTANDTLYAQWETGWNVVYTGNGNTGGVPPVDTDYYASGALVTLRGNPDSLVKTGHTFSGWNTVADGSGVSYVPGQILIIDNSDITLFAKWTAASYSITFNANGGVAPVPAVKEAVFGSVYGALAATSRAGYAFGGWWTKEDSGGAEITAASVVNITDNCTLFAKWNSYNYAVTFDGQGAAVQANPSVKTVISPAMTIDSLPTPPSKPGYAFGGWFTAPGGGGIAFTNATQVVSDLVVYARWSSAISWTQVDVGFSTNYLGKVAVGSGRGDGIERIYAGERSAAGSRAGIFEFSYSAIDTAWPKIFIQSEGFTSEIKDLVIGDVHNDGTVGVYAIGHGILEALYQAGTWSSNAKEINGVSLTWCNAVTIGPGRNNNYNNIYTTDREKIVEISYDFGNWTGTAVTTNSEAHQIIVAQARNDGINRLYVIMGSFSSGPVWEYTWNNSTSTYDAAQCSGLSTTAQFEILCVGTGRNDGIQRIYAWGGSGLYEFSYDGGTWTNVLVNSIPTNNASYNSGVELLLADGRNDGFLRLYTADMNGVGEYFFDGSWAKTGLITSKKVGGFDIGNGRNDGVNRIYVTSDYNLYEFTATP